MKMESPAQALRSERVLSVLSQPTRIETYLRKIVRSMESAIASMPESFG